MEVHFLGVVTNFVPGGRESPLLPSLFGRVEVQDRRFKFRTRDHYLDSRFYAAGTNGWVVSTNDPRLAWRKGEPRYNRRTQAGDRELTYGAVVVLSAALLLAPLAAYLHRRLRSRAVPR